MVIPTLFNFVFGAGRLCLGRLLSDLGVTVLCRVDARQYQRSQDGHSLTLLSKCNAQSRTLLNSSEPAPDVALSKPTKVAIGENVRQYTACCIRPVVTPANKPYIGKLERFVLRRPRIIRIRFYIRVAIFQRVTSRVQGDIEILQAPSRLLAPHQRRVLTTGLNDVRSNQENQLVARLFSRVRLFPFCQCVCRIVRAG